MEDKIYYLDFKTLENFMRDSLVGAGVPLEDAKICADVLITADKRGIDSHGIGRLKPIYIDRIRDGILNPKTTVEFVKKTPTTAVIDAHDGMGMVASKQAMQYAIDHAREYGMGMTVVRNSSHYGIAGYYALMAIQNGMIGITGTNARPSIAPTFGVENMLGTNPLTFGMPTDEPFPFFLDCATSVSQRGKIEVYGRAGKQLPPGWVIDEQGNTRTDTDQILIDLVKGKAALTPLGGLGEETAGYKGYGYATVVEILSAALQQGCFLKQLLGFSPKARSSRTISAISSSRSTSTPSAVWRTSSTRPARSSTPCAIPRRPPARNASTRPVRRNTKSCSNVRRRAFRSTPPSRRT